MTPIYTKQDGSEAREEMCEKCREAEDTAEYVTEKDQHSAQLRKQWQSEYGVEGIFLEKSFENFDRSLQPRAYDALHKWNGRSHVLMSPELFGVGKTHLVAALANRLVATVEPAYFEADSYHIRHRNCPARFTTESHLMSRIRATYGADRGPTDEAILSRLTVYTVLIIDDVGKVKPRDYSFLQSMYFRIIDDRYVLGKPIILTTNLTVDGFVEHIGEACGDRLREMCGRDGFIVMRGRSYRSHRKENE